MGIRQARRVGDITASGIRKVSDKAAALERAGEHVLHFELGRPDLDTPDYIKQACIRSLEAGEVFYTQNRGLAKLREAIAADLCSRKGLSCQADQIICTAGVSEGVFDTLLALVDPGDEVLVPDPGWVNYASLVRFLGAIPVPYDLLEERNYQADMGQLRARLSARTRAIVLINPSNPTGGLFTRETLGNIARFAVEADLAVISDEIYERIVYDNAEHTSMASLPGMGERTVLLGGFSKTYSMTGWRSGYIVAPQRLVGALGIIHQQNTNCVASFVQRASIAALLEEGDEVGVMVAEYQRRRDCAVSAINAIDGVSCKAPGGAFYIFVNVGRLAVDDATFVDNLLEKEHVAMVPGRAFGANGHGYVRMSFASPLDDIARGCELLGRAVARYRES